MENWDDDFSTLKARPRQLSAKPISAWKADIPIDDGDMTITKRQMPTKHRSSAGEGKPVQLMSFSDDDDSDFAADFEQAANARRHSTLQTGNNVVKPQAPVYSDAIDLSDSSTARSPDRASSISSVVSASSAATSWDHNDELKDSDFELDEVEFDLRKRLQARQERAKAEAALEQAKLSANYAKTLKKRQSRRPMVEFEEDLMDLGLDKLPLKVKSGTINKNIKFGLPPQSPPHMPPQSKMLRGMRSIAQMPNQRTESPQKLRAAVSMLDLGTRANEFGSRVDLETLRFNPPGNFMAHQSSGYASSIRLPMGTSVAPSSQTTPQKPQGQSIQQRPLTSYKDPKSSHSTHKKHKSKKPNLIQYPGQTLTKQKYNGMVLNPATGMWEGNEIEDSRFDLVLDQPVKPRLITKQSISAPEGKSLAPNGMLFDNRTLSWVYANEDEYDDPFAGIDDDANAAPFTGISSVNGMSTPNGHTTGTANISTPRHLRKVTNESTISTTSSYSNLGRTSVVRSESSGKEVFDVSTRLASEWRHIDERFMRKFGKWIGGDEERADSLLSDQQFYDMVRNA